MTGLEVTLLYLLVSIIPAAIAQARGRSAVTWFVLSLLMTPVLAGILVLVEPTTRSRSR